MMSHAWIRPPTCLLRTVRCIEVWTELSCGSTGAIDLYLVHSIFCKGDSGKSLYRVSSTRSLCSTHTWRQRCPRYSFVQQWEIIINAVRRGAVLKIAVVHGTKLSPFSNFRIFSRYILIVKQNHRGQSSLALEAVTHSNLALLPCCRPRGGLHFERPGSVSWKW